MSRDGKTFRQVHVIKEKNACRAANLYLGEQWTDIAKAIKIPLKTCPFPPVIYIFSVYLFIITLKVSKHKYLQNLEFTFYVYKENIFQKLKGFCLEQKESYIKTTKRIFI